MTHPADPGRGTARRRSPARSSPATAKAYLNTKFLLSPAARTLRLLSEYVEPLNRFQRYDVRDTIVMFGSARARPPEEVRPELAKAEREAQRASGRRAHELAERLRALRLQMELTRYYEEAAELSRLLTEWAKTLGPGRRFVVCSGGGPGIMEAANRGATERARGASIGLTISLPSEERPNPYITPELAFEFHYFFMRKFWFIYPSASLIVFPGGFGTLDELFEVLTLAQTRKISRPLPIVLYGARYWKEVLNLEALARWGTIGFEDLKLYRMFDAPRDAFEYLKGELSRHYRHPVLGGR